MISQKDPVSGKYRQILKRGFTTNRAATQWKAEFKVSKAGKSSVAFDEMLRQYLAANDSSDTAVTMKTNWLQNHFPMYLVRLRKSAGQIS